MHCVFGVHFDFGFHSVFWLQRRRSWAWPCSATIVPAVRAAPPIPIRHHARDNVPAGCDAAAHLTNPIPPSYHGSIL